MKNIKYYLLLIIGILFLSGCNVNYNLFITTDGKVQEKVLLVEDATEIDEEMTLTKKGFAENKFKDYKKEIEQNRYQYKYYETNTEYGYELTKTYDNLNEYLKESKLIEKGLHDIKRKDKFTSTTINAKNIDCDLQEVNCLFINNLNINVKSNKKIISTNGTKINDNINWNFENNKSNKINIELENTNYFLIILAIILAIIILIITIIIIYKVKRENNEL